MRSEEKLVDAACKEEAGYDSTGWSEVRGKHRPKQNQRKIGVIKSAIIKPIVPQGIDNSQDHSGRIPSNYTMLNILRPMDVTGSPETSARTAKTTPEILLKKLSVAIETHKGSEEVRGNIASGQLSIIPHSRTKDNLYLNIKKNDIGNQKGISVDNYSHAPVVSPNGLFGRSVETFSSFGQYYADYSTSLLLKDPDIKSLLRLGQNNAKKACLEEKGHELREQTHHSEQFFIAAIYKSLLALKDSKLDLKDSTFILDIATELAPCDHCVRAIDDLFNHLRNIVDGNNYFIARLTWLKEYHGRSPSVVSASSRRSELLDGQIDIDDANKNYFFTLRATERMLNAAGTVMTGSGIAARDSTSILSSNTHEDPYANMHNIAISNGHNQFSDSPPRSKTKPGRNKVNEINAAFLRIERKVTSQITGLKFAGISGTYLEAVKGWSRKSDDRAGISLNDIFGSVLDSDPDVVSDSRAIKMAKPVSQSYLDKAMLGMGNSTLSRIRKSSSSSFERPLVESAEMGRDSNRVTKLREEVLKEGFTCSYRDALVSNAKKESARNK
ncbi:MAG: hypothetical protein HOM96_00020 [Rickettsiales bacterium]|jgi:hypothetical protein|nr:hypothetical protein [Rickettsiales bacterium]